jgi:hypothetical protein
MRRRSKVCSVFISHRRYIIRRVSRIVNKLLTRTEYVSKYATREAIDDNGAESDDDDDMSSVASFGSDDNDEAAGTMEEL